MIEVFKVFTTNRNPVASISKGDMNDNSNDANFGTKNNESNDDDAFLTMVVTVSVVYGTRLSVPSVGRLKTPGVKM